MKKIKLILKNNKKVDKHKFVVAIAKIVVTYDGSSSKNFGGLCIYIYI